MRHRHLRVICGSALAIAVGTMGGTSATAQVAAAQPAAAAAPDTGEIIVTARGRSESLNRTPVVVSVVGSDAIVRANAINLTKIGELVPSVIIGNYGASGGGTLGIRGISTPANNAGFEQAVSVAIDGVQTSDGHVALLGFFDVQQVEVLKGPQALLFGKNNTAGVISIKTADPTRTLSASLKQSYEFVGDETITEGFVSGPLGENFGARIAVRYRNLDGWLRNTARPLANPFYNAATGAPLSASVLPGTTVRRPGDDEILGRLTLKGNVGPVTARLKLFGASSRDDGVGTYTQNIGPCVGPFPRVYGVADPTAECKVDNKTTVGDASPVIAQSMYGANESGKAFGKNLAVTASLDLEADLGQVTLNSISGYIFTKYHFYSGNDQTTLSQIIQADINRNTQLSQEFRLTTKFDGPLNFMIGGFYQYGRLRDHTDVFYGTGNYQASNGRFDSFEGIARQNSDTLSGFAQALWKVTPELELAGGARYTRGTKTFNQNNVYGIGAFNTLGIRYPGSDEVGYLKGKFKDSNVSPEATITWRPASNRTFFVAYKTGFKSGGFGVTNPLQVSTLIGDNRFGSEKARGLEVGAKGTFMDNRLRLSAAAFAYDFTNLQVSVFNPERIAYIVSNAGKLRQHGAELEANFRANSMLTLHGAVAWVHNRFHNYVGQCFGYTFPAGTVRATATPPAPCTFVNTTSLTLQYDYEGRPPARSPEWSGNSGFEFTAPLGSRKLTLTGDAFYSGGYYAADTLQSNSYQRATWRLNSGITYARSDDRWSIGLIGRNLTNKYYLIYATARTGGTGYSNAVAEQRGLVSRGREITLQAGVKF